MALLAAHSDSYRNELLCVYAFCNRAWTWSVDVGACGFTTAFSTHTSVSAALHRSLSSLGLGVLRRLAAQRLLRKTVVKRGEA